MTPFRTSKAQSQVLTSAQAETLNQLSSATEKRRGIRGFSFYQHRFHFLYFSAALLLIGIICLFVFGAKLDIQFKGGSIVKLSFVNELDQARAETVIEEALNKPVSVQITTALDANKGEKTQALVVNVAGNEALTTQEQQAMTEALTQAFPDQQISWSEARLVNPFIGRQTLINGLLAVLIASVLIVLYVWIRFRTISGASAGIFSLIALLHDVAIAFLTFIVLRLSLNETVIAVVLSILGWSVNDTIVIFDRIRENERLYRGRMSLPDLVDLSIQQSFSRSINTSLCSFLAVFVAFLFAQYYNLPSISEFALPMMVGIVIGSYSSICLATPLWAMFKTRKGRSGFES